MIMFILMGTIRIISY